MELDLNVLEMDWPMDWTDGGWINWIGLDLDFVLAYWIGFEHFGPGVGGGGVRSKDEEK